MMVHLPGSFLYIVYFILAILLIMSAIIDLMTHKIPNSIVLLIAGIGLSLNLFTLDGVGLRECLIGLMMGLILMLPSYIFAGMGAGDVKLMAAIGSVVGVDSVLNIVFFSYIAIFLMAIFFIITKGDSIKLVRRYWFFLTGLLKGVWRYQKPDKADAASCRLPLAPAIAIATFYVLGSEIFNSGIWLRYVTFRSD
ncbi:prepilin peptidase [Methyloglobulus sp.]|uniref:A24 family peptidase n=1 Tax=Methyloglobulus sp. TaxID=2518622 RepID=UPI003989884C